MGLLDNVTSAAGGFLKGQNSDIINVVLKMLANNEHGGLSGLIKSFQDKGLGGIISSWISNDENKPISDEQMREGFGEERIKDISQQTGKSSDTIISTLKSALPQIIDKVSPEGNEPDNNLLQKGLKMLQGI